MKIVAVIVTYNRLTLLRKCINAVAVQTRVPDNILIINNGSTDGTLDWLKEQKIQFYTKENNGGAGGFSYGIEKAFNYGADWIWLMDDDTIPTIDALEQLEKALTKLGSDQEKVGFLSSSVFWSDGNYHEMNRTHLSNDKSKLANFSFANKARLSIIQFGTFVSMLLSAKAVEKVGLPIKEFFIWGDDFEYSKRIINSGLAGLGVKESVVMHDTPTNFQSNVFTDPQSSLWKFNYGLRNELFTKRLHEGEGKFWFSWIHRIFIMPFRIIARRKDHRWPFIKVVWKTSFKAIFFRPTVERAQAIL